MIKPTRDQIWKVKYSDSFIGCYVSKTGVEKVITELEKIRGKDSITKEAAEEQRHFAYWQGFEDAEKLMQVPDCPFCGSKMEAGYACGEAFITPVGYRQGEGCPKCRNVPMHGNLKQVLEDWKNIRDIDARVEKMCKNNPGIKDFEDFNKSINSPK